MNKIILIAVLFLLSDLDAQIIYSLKTEPLGIHKENGLYKAFPLYDIQFSFKDRSESKFFYEVQPGIIFNGVTPHLDLFMGGESSIIYFKVGIKFYLPISGGGHSGPSIGSGFLPCLGTGFYLLDNSFIEMNYMIGFASIGLGINL